MTRLGAQATRSCSVPRKASAAHKTFAASHSSNSSAVRAQAARSPTTPWTGLVPISTAGVSTRVEGPLSPCATYPAESAAT